MTCESVQKAIPLYMYGELPPETEENVEAHTAECLSCQAEMERHRSLASTLNCHELEPSLDLLVECRQTLAVNLRDKTNQLESSPLGWWRRLLDLSVDFRVPVGALALVALGYFGARILPLASGGFSGSGIQSSGMISTVRSVQPDASGRIQIAVDDVRRRVVSGGAGDDNIRKLLLTAVREEANAGVRVESVAVLKDLAGSEDVRNALLEALQRDANPGVRLKALDGLKRFSTDDAVRKALTSVLLSDSNPGVRIQVIDLLVSKPDDSMVGVLQNLVHKDDNNYVRLRCERALQEMNASVGTF